MKHDYKHFCMLSEYLNYLVKRGLAKDKTEALKKARLRIPKESYFQARILKYLNSRPLGLKVFAWKNQAGLYQERGLPDISAIVNGQYIGFEVKRPLLNEKTELQKTIAQQIETAGGKVFFVSYVDEVEMILKTLR